MVEPWYTHTLCMTLKSMQCACQPCGSSCIPLPVQRSPPSSSPASTLWTICESCRTCPSGPGTSEHHTRKGHPFIAGVRVPLLQRMDGPHHADSPIGGHLGCFYLLARVSGVHGTSQPPSAVRPEGARFYIDTTSAQTMVLPRKTGASASILSMGICHGAGQGLWGRVSRDVARCRGEEAPQQHLGGRPHAGSPGRHLGAPRAPTYHYTPPVSVSVVIWHLPVSVSLFFS